RYEGRSATCPERQGLASYDQPELLVAHDGENARRQREKQERQFLGQQQGPGPWLEHWPVHFFLGGSGPVAPKPDSIERPNIEQQKDTGQRDQDRLGQQSEGHAEKYEGVAAHRRFLRIAYVGAGGEQPKRPAQQILSFSDPCDAFDLQRVYRPECCHQRAGPHRPGHAPDDAEQEQHIDHVEEQAHEVVRPGFQAEQLAIHHVAHPGERMPVSELAAKLAKRPGQPVRRETPLDAQVLRHVIGIIVENEFVLAHAPEHRHGQENKRRWNEPASGFAGRGSHTREVGKSLVEITPAFASRYCNPVFKQPKPYWTLRRKLIEDPSWKYFVGQVTSAMTYPSQWIWASTWLSNTKSSEFASSGSRSSSSRE